MWGEGCEDRLVVVAGRPASASSQELACRRMPLELELVDRGGHNRMAGDFLQAELKCASK